MRTKKTPGPREFELRRAVATELAASGQGELDLAEIVLVELVPVGRGPVVIELVAPDLAASEPAASDLVELGFVALEVPRQPALSARAPSPTFESFLLLEIPGVLANHGARYREALVKEHVR
jgi:hypothetical protein